MPAGTSIPTDGDAAAAAPDAMLRKDVQCIACGYNLRGLMPTLNCPECGVSIQSTLAEIAERRFAAAPPLWRCDCGWLTQLTEGVALVMLALGCMTLIAIAPDEFWAFRHAAPRSAARHRVQRVGDQLVCGVETGEP